jgi:hypothetical protein
MEGSDRNVARWVIALLLFALIASLAAAVPARATFNGIGTISDQRAVTPKVAMDEDGTAVFAWNAFYSPTADCGSFFCFRIEARVRPKSGAIGPIETISDPFRITADPDVAVDDDGNAIFVWGASNPTGKQTIEARRRSATGVLGPIVVLSDPGESSFAPQVVVGDNGKAVFAWQANDGTTDCGGSGCSTIQTRTLSAAGALSPIQKLSDPARFARLPQLGVDDEGNSVFVWFLTEPSDSCGSCTRIQARARSATGGLKAVQTLATGYAGAPQIAVDEDGNAVFVWDRFDGSDDCGGGECSRIQARRRSASGSLSSTQTLSSAGQDAISPQVAVDGAGKATFVWTRGDGTDDCEESACYRVQTRTRTAGGTLGSTNGLSHSGWNALAPQVAVDERGNAVFVWERLDQTVDCGEGSCRQVQVRSRTPGGSLTGTKTFPNLGPNAAPMVAVDPDGGADSSRADAAVDWIGPGELIEAAVQIGGS